MIPKKQTNQHVGSLEISKDPRKKSPSFLSPLFHEPVRAVFFLVGRYVLSINMFSRLPFGDEGCTILGTQKNSLKSIVILIGKADNSQINRKNRLFFLSLPEQTTKPRVWVRYQLAPHKKRGRCRKLRVQAVCSHCTAFTCAGEACVLHAIRVAYFWSKKHF